MALGLTPKQIIEKNTHPMLSINDTWERINISEICTIQNGYAFSSEDFNNSEGLPLIRIRDIFHAKTENFYSGKYLDEFLVKKNDFLIGMDGDFKISKWPGKKGLLNQRVCRLIHKSLFYDKQFLFYCLQPYLDAIHAETSAVTVKHLSSKTISEIPLPLPPYPEQKTIVKKIETLFSSLDAGIAGLKKSQEQLKIYRQAVLKKAFDGELTNEWRKQQTNLPTVEELLFQIEQECKEYYHIQIEEWKLALQYWEENKSIGKKPEKPSINKIKIDASTKLESGFYAKLGSISDVVRGGSPRPAGDERFYNGNIPFLKVADITRINNKYLTEFTYTIKPAGLQKTRFLKKGTLVISNSGATLGVARILGIDATANDGIAAFLNLLPRLTDFFYYYLNSKTLEFRAIDQGAGQPNLNTDLLKEFIVPIFSVNEQQQIVQEIESRLSACDDVEKQIKKSLDQAEALRQSILKKAFEGNLLTEEELRACKAEPDYEPASVLLERIKAEKEAHKPVKKISKKKVS